MMTLYMEKSYITKSVKDSQKKIRANKFYKVE